MKTRSLKFAFFILAVIILLVALLMSSGCRIDRDLRKSRSGLDSISSKKEISVSSRDSKSRDSSAWWREIVNLMPKDCVVVNNYYPQTKSSGYVPIQIIREGGTSLKQNSDSWKDSFMKAAMDSISKKTEVKQVQEKVKVLDFWQIIAIGAIVVLFLTNILKFKR